MDDRLTECRTVVTSARTRVPVHIFSREQSSDPPALGSRHVPHTLPCQLDTRAIMSDPVSAHMPVRAFSRSSPQPACTQSSMTSMPRQPVETRVGPPLTDHLLTSALTHLPIAHVDDVMTSMPRQPVYPSSDDELISALSRLLTAPSEEVLMSALLRPLPVPGDLPYADDAMQRVTQRVDNRTDVCTHSVDSLAHLLPPPPVHRKVP